MTSSLEISSSILDPGAEDVVKLVSLRKKKTIFREIKFHKQT